eukprot:scaffold4257_cov22-Tisochrysis_lutea.AAC.1
MPGCPEATSLESAERAESRSKSRQKHSTAQPKRVLGCPEATPLEPTVQKVKAKAMAKHSPVQPQRRAMIPKGTPLEPAVVAHITARKKHRFYRHRS